MATGLKLLPPPPPPPSEASAAPVCTSCNAVSCEAVSPKSRRAKISSCGISGVLLSSILGASASPVMRTVATISATCEAAVKSSVGPIRSFRPAPLNVTFPLEKVSLLLARVKKPRCSSKPPLTRGASVVPCTCS